MKVLEELEILKMVCQRLEKTGIPYMITGSIAANFYSVPRMTRDVDIVIEIQKENASRMVKAFQDDFYIDQDSVAEAIARHGMFNIIHNESIFKVDFIVRKESAYRELEFQRRRRVEVEGVQIWVVTPEDLILSKLFWAKESLSELQLGDVNDTSPQIEEKIRELISVKTPEERLKMGCSMYDFSRRLVIHSILENQPGLSAEELRRELFLRFYGNDFNPKQRQEILEYLS